MNVNGTQKIPQQNYLKPRNNMQINFLFWVYAWYVCQIKWPSFLNQSPQGHFCLLCQKKANKQTKQNWMLRLGLISRHMHEQWSESAIKFERTLVLRWESLSKQNDFWFQFLLLNLASVLKSWFKLRHMNKGGSELAIKFGRT